MAAANPGEEPGPAVRRSWDRRAWAEARPDKVVPTDGAELVAAGGSELHDLGYRDPTQPGCRSSRRPDGGCHRPRRRRRDRARPGSGARRSAWNAADIRGEVEKWVAATGLVADAAVRGELAEDLTARTIAAASRCSTGRTCPSTSGRSPPPHVLDVEADLVDPPRRPRADTPANPQAVPPVEGLDDAQREAVAALAGEAQLVVVEGAAGAGKTTTLAAAKSAVEAAGHRMVVVTPTLKAAQVAAREVGHAGIGRVAGPSARLPVGRRRPLDPGSRHPRRRRRLRRRRPAGRR